MSDTNGTPSAAPGLAGVRDEWVAAVTALVDQVEGWCKELDWATRRAAKRVKDDRAVGPYEVPMLLMQHWDAKLLLTPVSRVVAGGGGRVDLYTMPEYDDVAALLWEGGAWQMYVQLGAEQRDPVPLTRETFRDVVETFARRHAEA